MYIYIKDFQTSIKRSPPDVTSRSSLSIWLCHQHNEVNSKLDKPAFDCNIHELNKRWKDGHNKCWEDA